MTSGQEKHPSSCIQINKTTFLEGEWSTTKEGDMIYFKNNGTYFHRIYTEDKNKIVRTTRLPFPTPTNKKYYDELDEFISKFKRMPADDGEDYDSYYSCVLCDWKEGMGDYEYTNKETGITFRWYEGLIHYYVEHKVMPSERFYNFVMNVISKEER